MMERASFHTFMGHLPRILPSGTSGQKHPLFFWIMELGEVKIHKYVEMRDKQWRERERESLKDASVFQPMDPITPDISPVSFSGNSLLLIL